ncbi:MAG TPA: ABC transporter permease subunit [Verrucomicrobiae bacterium]|jgi:ABC-type transport system involved in multi-copper enzyme maturation permease subunit|nr:ABC transporter permease subunit [Verrucomicrobiae bacterium]
MKKVLAIAGIVVKELYRRKDFYVLFIITVLLSLVMASVNFFNDDKIVRYLKELCLLLIWIASLVIAITTAARQIPAEREQRTLLPLLAKPVSRSQVLLGKFAGCWLACGGTLVCFYLFFGLLAMSREHSWPLLNYVQAMTLHWMLLGIVIAFVLFGSLVFAAPSSNTTISFVLVLSILVLGRHLNKVALQFSEPGRTITYTIYYLIPHLELFDVRDLIIHNWPLIPWQYWAAALAYGGFFSALFIWLGCWAFQRKPVN